MEGFLPVTATRLPMHQVSLAGTVYEQHPGVFSAGHIDYATQFLLEEWSTNPLLLDLPAPESIIDIGCGNGVIGDQLLARYPRAHLTATDVSELALASARHNLRQHGFGERVKVLTASSLAAVLDPALFDLIVTNPPFHDGHQTDISVPLEIFQTASGRLSPAGALVVVANRHLNYLTHLRRYFAEVRIVAENNKFVIYRCR
ncbi:MAG: class I SAM-dependent methyltransferase [Bacteroidota bacterium]